MPTKKEEERYSSPLDLKIAKYVVALNDAGIQTFESCQGGEVHAYPEPTIRFSGTQACGFRALVVAMDHAWPVIQLRRVWRVMDGVPEGPYWDLVFHPEGL